MAIAVKVDGWTLLNLLGVEKALVALVKKAGVSIEVEPTRIKFRMPEGIGGSEEVPVKFEHIKQLQAGTLGNLSKQSLKLMVTATLKKLNAKLGSAAATPGPAPKAEGGATVLGVMQILNKPASVVVKGDPEQLEKLAASLTAQPGKLQVLETEKAANPAQEPPYGYFTGQDGNWELGKLKTAPTVPLRNATKLYQPVKGSSATSRYFLVAAGKGIRVAARYRQQNLSIRIEGQEFASHKAQMEACGFHNVATDYASMHLQVADPVLAAKALGAVLLGLGIQLDTPLPDLTKLKDLGS